ncbi:uncharacterized protein LOC141858691 [Brevipalpus obovatus]|uniref:uncharacterized protein LOC141858691 n=1 Tax=Brevipalpus obovatus TaxID=246614 RepID=UPI003D9F6171
MMDSPNEISTIKIMIVGPRLAGKTSLIEKYTDDWGQAEKNGPLIPFSLMTKEILIDGKQSQLTLLDINGGERFLPITSKLFPFGGGFMFVYDVTDYESFRKIEIWLKKVDQLANHSAFKLLIGNKHDKRSDRVVSKEAGLGLARKYGVHFMETSIEDSEGIKGAFNMVLSNIKKH